MQYIVLVHPKHYDHRDGRFVDMAFKSSNDGSGASIVLEECGITKSGSLCDHIRHYYPGIGGEPPVFWRFDDSALTEPCVIEQVDGPNGDKCHYEIKSKTSRKALNKSLRSHSKGWEISDLTICDAVLGQRQLTLEDLVNG